MGSRRTSAIRFKVLARLGSGGMADVHLATMTRGPEQRLVALKRIHPHLLLQPGMVETFEREARISALLSHPHIAAVHAFGTDASGPYLALEYVEGRSASTLLSFPAQVDPTVQRAASLRIIGDVASAVAHAHAFSDDAAGVSGVVHRDISLDNVLVSYAGCAKLADFGIAMLVGATRVTRTGVLKGKFGFIAPELFEGHPADAQSDVFALAAAAFQLLTGMKPFPGNTEAEILRAVLGTEPPALSTLRPDLPEAVSTWVERGLKKSPSERLLASALAHAIDEALKGLPGEGRDALAELMDQSFPSDVDVRRASTSRLVHRHTRTVESSGATRRAWALGVGAVSLAAIIAVFAAAQLDPDSPEPLETAVVDRAVAEAPSGAAEPGADEERNADGDRRPVAAVASVAAPMPAPVAATPALPKSEAVSEGRRSDRTTPRRAAIRTAKQERKTPKVVRTGTLRLRIQPWANVHVNGAFKGVTPMDPLVLPVGTHTLLLTNDELRIRRRVKVNIRADREELLKLALD